MKKTLITLLAIALATMAASAAQKTVTLQDVAHPRLLAGVLNDNVSDAETRLDAVEAGTLSGDLNVADDAIIGDDLTVTGDVSVAGAVAFDADNTSRNFTLSSDYTVIHAPHFPTIPTNYVLSHVAGIYKLSSAEAITCTVANSTAAGEMFTVYNAGAGTITFADDGNLKLVGDAVLKQDGMLGLYSVDGTNWWQAAKWTD